MSEPADQMGKLLTATANLTDAVNALTKTMPAQVAEEAVAKFDAEHPRPEEAAIPPLIKWLVGAIAAFGSAALIGLGFWLVSSVSALLVTTARIDERMASGGVKDARFEELDRRVTKLETYHQGVPAK